MADGLTHLTGQGEVHMVDVGDRDISRREAVAEGCLRMETSTLQRIIQGDTPKGDLLAVARIAAIQGAKRTSELIPLCHPLPLSGIEVAIKPDQELPGLQLQVHCRTTGQTGVEMEALTAVSIGLVTLYDMLKSVDPGMTIETIGLVEKHGGRHGSWHRQAAGHDG
ncbi:cyclic pyranopterin monophosphate synthase MoaC [Synechococcus sp. BS55D]|uniref:cyclic pyranopterin monophosphate synthase MoaC n=1 Tax=Synechococcus sp. BS55D TaxID=2055943 RepID=UPI00103F3664|nr:cyclic pyranopterin monophosphate synthase MoaC [Synechococcus sp. BS55D]TCD57963.1 cyclic pyranopterin monophosphate synthase MoaC [Synechococcus sp. BS55D]